MLCQLLTSAYLSRNLRAVPSFLSFSSNVYRRKLSSKANLESSASHFSFNRWN